MDFDSVYRNYFKAVFAYIILRVQNQTLAEELSSKTWQKVFDKFHSYDPQKGRPEQWLFTIARNEINMYFRLYYVRKVFSLSDYETELASPMPEISEELEHKEQREALLNAMSALKQGQRDLLALKFYSGLNNREIAKLTKLSESNVGTILNRSIEKLRSLLEVK